MKEKICGIYCIENKINGHKYVGLSKDCMKRWSDHYSKCIHSKKEDDIRKPLYMAMRKYGRDNFSFTIIEECPEDKLKEREMHIRCIYDAYKFIQQTEMAREMLIGSDRKERVLQAIDNTKYTKVMGFLNANFDRG